MAKNEDTPAQPPADPGKPPPRFVASDEDKAKARKWFARAKEVSASKNYDYAVELYLNGLAAWPDAIEEGLRPLRVVATARRMNGGKPAGFMEARKYAGSGKDPLKNLQSALFLFAKAPANLPHIEHILAAAAKARCDRTVQWIAPLLVEAYTREKKLSESRYAASCEAMELAADIAMAISDADAAGELLHCCLRTAEIWKGHYPASNPAEQRLSHATGKLTIVKGRFGDTDDFRASLHKADEQRDKRDADSVMQSADRVQQLIDRARKEVTDHPEVPMKVLNLADLLTRREDDATENEAISLLEAEHARTHDYNMKVKADDIRMRQRKRHVRDLQARAKAEPQNRELAEEIRHATTRQIRGEIAIYRDRVDHYPTDMRLRFQLAKRLFAAKQYEAAIPLLQAAEGDAKSRDDSRYYLGLCFYEKAFYDQAIETFRQALEEIELRGGQLFLDLSYWLGRSLEAVGQPAEAKKVYGQVVRVDYNFRDARERLGKLSGEGGRLEAQE